LSPIHDGGEQGHVIGGLIRDRLVAYDDSEKVVPALATSWETPDPKTWIFHLRTDAKFSTGALVSATDVKYTLDRIRQNDSQIAGVYGTYINTVTIVDPHTVNITLNVPYPDLLVDMADDFQLGIVPNNWLETCGSNCETTVVGAGPFMLKEWVKGDHLTRARNPYYYRAPQPYLDSVIFRVVQNPETAIADLRTGAADVLYSVPLQDVGTLQKTSNVVVYTHGSGLLTEIAMNTAVAPFTSLAVRQAISLGIDRNAIVQTALYGYGEVARGVFPSAMPEYDPSTPAPTYDPDKAKQLLAQAGYGPSNPLKFTLRTTTEAFTPDEAVLIQSQLAKIGVQVQIQQVEKSAFYGVMFRQPGTDYRQWQAGMAVYFWTTVPRWYVYAQWDKNEYVNSTGVNLPGGYPDPTLQSLLDQARSGSNPATLKGLYAQINNQLNTDALYALVAYQQNVQASTSKVHGFKAFFEFEYPLRYVWLSK